MFNVHEIEARPPITNPFSEKEFLGFTMSVEGYTESAQFTGEDWYTQKHVDTLRSDLTRARKFEEYYQTERNKEAEKVRLMARVINDYLEENAEDEDIVASFQTLFDKDCDVADPRRQEYEMEVEVTIRRTYRLTVECPSYKFDDMVEHLGDVFDTDDTVSTYEIENEWCIVRGLHEHDVEVDNVEVGEL